MLKAEHRATVVILLIAVIQQLYASSKSTFNVTQPCFDLDFLHCLDFIKILDLSILHEGSLVSFGKKGKRLINIEKTRLADLSEHLANRRELFRTCFLSPFKGKNC